MDLSRLSTAHKIGIGGAVVLLIDMFLPWYSVDLGLSSVSISAWDSGFLAWGACVAGVAAGVILVLKATGKQDVTAGGKSAEQIAMILGSASFVLAVLRFITERRFMAFGLFLGILAAAAVAYGTYKVSKDVGGAPSSMGTPPPPSM